MKDYIISGQVIHGFDKGKTMGFPTYNLKLAVNYPLEDWQGVWCSLTYYRKQKLFGFTHIGPVRIFQEEKIRVKTHLFDWQEDLYGEQMQVELLVKLRDTIDFTNQTDLIRQVMEDLRQELELILRLNSFNLKKISKRKEKTDCLAIGCVINFFWFV